jgi:DNA-binding MarR family transcriptional regulator
MSNPDPLLPLLQEWHGMVMRRSMRSLIQHLKENDLSMSQIGALFQIDRGRSNVSDLAERLGISIAAASQMLERLVQQALIRRSEDPQDRRAKQLVLTEKGRRIIREVLEARQGWLEELAASMSASEKEQVAAAVGVLIDKTHQFEQQLAAGR